MDRGSNVLYAGEIKEIGYKRKESCSICKYSTGRSYQLSCINHKVFEYAKKYKKDIDNLNIAVEMDSVCKFFKRAN